jgi:hypothetical protein
MSAETQGAIFRRSTIHIWAQEKNQDLISPEIVPIKYSHHAHSYAMVCAMTKARENGMITEMLSLLLSEGEIGIERGTYTTIVEHK